jgi:hypothetical protein
MQGWHAHLVESGTKPHDINAGARNSMPLYRAKRFLGFVKRLQHPGAKKKTPFKRAIDATWQDVAQRVADKMGDIMANEIKVIQREYMHSDKPRGNRTPARTGNFAIDYKNVRMR